MKTIQDVMTKDVITLNPESPISEASQQMRDHDVGDVVVTGGEGYLGILTDRDIVVRALAEGLMPDAEVGDVASTDLVTVLRMRALTRRSTSCAPKPSDVFQSSTKARWWASSRSATSRESVIRDRHWVRSVRLRRITSAGLGIRQSRKREVRGAHAQSQRQERETV